MLSDADEHAFQENKFGAILSFDWRGRVCSFSPELLGETHPRFGPIAVDVEDWATFCSNPTVVGLVSEIDAGIAKCGATCEYFMVCGGGAPSNKLAEHGTCDSTETLHCRLRIKAGTEAVLRFAETSLGI
jgi:uncharacterized protein